MRRSSIQKSGLHRSIEEATATKIVITATELFARKGYDATSTKEICESAGVNIAAIHYYFESKENLFNHIIETLISERLESVQRILQPVVTFEEMNVRLHIFVSESLDACFKQTSVCKIVQHEMECDASRGEEVFRKTFLRLFETLHAFLKGAQQQGLIGDSIQPQIAAKFLFSQISDAVRRETVNKKYFGMSFDDEQFKKIWLEQTVGIFLGGIQPRVEK